MQSTRGFTLLELSVVFVILGLLAGGIVAGRALIRAGEMRSITADMVKYQTAINAFRTKYDGLPGDLEDATTYWGAAHATPATCRNTPSTDMLTCNGNGDGHITSSNGTATVYEAFRAWQHLSNAGFIQGLYNGISEGSNRTSKIGVNVPPGRTKGTGYSLVDIGTYTNTNWFNDTYNHVLLYGTQYFDWDTTGPAIAPEDMMSIDTKMDDSRPFFGVIMTWKNSGCTTSNTVTAEYELSDRRSMCNIIYKLGF